MKLKLYAVGGKIKSWHFAIEATLLYSDQLQNEHSSLRACCCHEIRLPTAHPTRRLINFICVNLSSHGWDAWGGVGGETGCQTESVAAVPMVWRWDFSAIDTLDEKGIFSPLSTAMEVLEVGALSQQCELTWTVRFNHSEETTRLVFLTLGL